jgi:hypothetical protein
MLQVDSEIIRIHSQKEKGFKTRLLSECKWLSPNDKTNVRDLSAASANVWQKPFCNRYHHGRN